jgi:3-oxoacyl-[acyl-carrier-protein] synthase-3
MHVKIVSMCRHLPDRVETSEELAPRIGVTADWIKSRTGVLRRHISDEPMDVMAARVARQALSDGPPPDLILNASGVPHQLLPDGSVFIQAALGYSGIPSHSVHATCLSFPVALHVAACSIAAGAYRRILVVSSEWASRGRNFAEPESASLFGDGAAAAVVEPTPDGESSEVLGFQMVTFPEGASLTEVRGGGMRLHPLDPATRPADNLFHMDGPEVFKMAIPRVRAVFDGLWAQTGARPKDVKALVTHQSSGPGVDALRRWGFTRDQIVKRVHEEGNCVAASIPMTLAYAVAEGRIQRGDLVVLCGTGAGLSILTMLLRW